MGWQKNEVVYLFSIFKVPKWKMGKNERLMELKIFCEALISLVRI